MRKFFLWLMLFALVLVPSIAGAVESSPVELGKVGVFKVFKPMYKDDYGYSDVTVQLKNGEVIYPSMDVYRLESVVFGAAINGSYNTDMMLPSGIMTTQAGESALKGKFSTEYGNIINYGAGIALYGGLKARWSLNSTPASIGSTVLPPYNAWHFYDVTSMDIGNVLPYVELERKYGGPNITGIKVFFVESGDTKPVPIHDVSSVRISVENNGNGYTGTKLSAAESFSGFSDTEPIICTMSANLKESDKFTVYLAFDKGDDTFVWSFSHDREYNSYPDNWTIWRNEYGLQNIHDSSIDVKITLSGDIYFDSFFAGNNEIISLDYEMSKDVYSNDVILAIVTPKKPGYTTLRLKYSIYGDAKTDIKSVIVDSQDNDGHWRRKIDWEEESPLKAQVHDYSYRINVNHVGGKPYYETATVTGYVAWDMVGSDDASFNDADVTLSVGSYYSYSSRKLKYEGEGRFSVRDRDGEEVLLSNSDSAWNQAPWIEAPGYEELNGLVSMPMSNYKTREDIVNGDFVPYVEFIYDGRTLEKIKWSFINPHTKEIYTSLPSGIKNLRVSTWSLDSLDSAKTTTEPSGEFNTSLSYVTVYIGYTLNDENYIWSFDSMNDASSLLGNLGKLSKTLRISADVAIDVSFDIYSSYYRDYYKDYSFMAVVSSSDILSVDTTSIDLKKDRQTITLYGKKTGEARLSFVFFNPYKDSPDIWRSALASSQYLIYVGDYEPEKPEIIYTPPKLHLESYDDHISYASLVEGKPIYYDLRESSDVTFRLENDKKIFISRASFDNTAERAKLLGGTLTITSATGDISSQDVTLSFSNYSSGTYPSINVYYDVGVLDNGTTVSWNFPSLGLEGEETTSFNHVRSPLEQHNTYKPSVEFIIDGFYITGIKWGFVDSKDNPVEASMVHNIKLNVELSGEWSEYSLQGTSGDIIFDEPQPFTTYRCYLNFTEDGVNYEWHFNESINLDSWAYSHEWNIASTDFPIVMKIGESKNINLHIPFYRVFTLKNLTVLTSTAILSADITGESIIGYDHDITLRITAQESGVATFSVSAYNLTDNSNISYKAPVEVWIYDDDDMVSGLSDTETATTMLENIAAGYGVSYDVPVIPEPEPEPEPEPVRIWRYLYDGTTEIENEDAIRFSGEDYEQNNLSVRPRFAVPQYPSDEAVSTMNDYVDEHGYPNVMDIEDRNLMASRDVLEVFDYVKYDLISLDTPQVLAIVLPVISLDEAGVYTFSVSMDNIPSGKELFFYTAQYSLSHDISPDIRLFLNSSGNIIDSKPYYTDTIEVAVYLEPGTYEPIITADATQRDIEIITGYQPLEVNITNVSLDAGKVGEPYFGKFTANFSDGVRWSFSSGVLPTGLVLNPDGTVTGTPAEAGNFPLTVTAYYRGVRGSTHCVLTITGDEPSPDVPPTPTSPDVDPTSPDVPPTPTSPDVRPTSPDVNPTSQDTRPVTSQDTRPVQSQDVRPVTSRDTRPVVSDDTRQNTTSGDQSGGNNTGNNSGGGNTITTIKPVSAVPEPPRVNIQAVTVVVKRAIRTLTSLITDSTEVAELPASASGSRRTVDDLSEEDKADIPSSQTTAAVLPIMKVTAPAVYVFGVDLKDSGITAQSPIYMHMMAEPSASAEMFTDAEDAQDASVFLDDEGNEITTVPDNLHVNVAAYMTPEYTYAPVITTDAPESSGTGPDDSSGGCSEGFSLYALVVAAWVLLRKK